MMRQTLRTGFSLLEVMVALTLLGLVMVSLARASEAVTVFGKTNDLVAKRTAVLQMEANKFEAVPYSTLSTWSTTAKSLTWNGFTYTRRLTITSASSTRYTVKIVVVPDTSNYHNASDTTKKDSVSFDRITAPTSPLCVGC